MAALLGAETQPRYGISLRPWIVVLLVLLAMASVAAIHYKVWLFDDYRAGFNSVEESQVGTGLYPCYRMHAGDRSRPETEAFLLGCQTNAAGHDFDYRAVQSLFNGNEEDDD